MQDDFENRARFAEGKLSANKWRGLHGLSPIERPEPWELLLEQDISDEVDAQLFEEELRWVCWVELVVGFGLLGSVVVGLAFWWSVS